MRLSNNTIVVADYPQPGDALLYNTRTQALVKINDELKRTLDDYAEAPEGVKARYAQDIAALHTMGIVVRDENEDRERLRDFLQQMKFGVNPSVFAVTILTTYACNFKCTYCFEESSRTHEKMTIETADQAMNWLKEKVTANGYRELHITFYGGEPLLNKPVLEYIAVHMKAWCENRGIPFGFMLQTNGYLMTPDVVDKYLPIGLTSVRISVDGVDEDHDRNRPLRGGGKTFSRVMDNIIACADKVKIGISVGYEKDDVSGIARLLQYLDEKGVLHKLGRFVCSAIHPTLGPRDNPKAIQRSSCMGSYDDDVLAEANRKISGLMEERGLAHNVGLFITTCPLTRENAGGTIDQKGYLYRCNSMLGHPEFSTGHVRANTYSETHKTFLHLDVWRQCPQDCTYLPMCSGGCRLSAFLKHKNMRTPNCHKRYLNRMAPEFIKRDYQKIVAAKAIAAKAPDKALV